MTDAEALKILLSDILLQQRTLRGLNYNPGPLDGRYGTRTTDAVIDFQKDHGLKVDGRLGPNTGKALMAEIKWVQTNLNSAGFNPGPIDGLFGTQTRRALVKFQMDKGLIADGVVGPRTRGAFKGKVVPQPPPAKMPPTANNVVLDDGHGGYDPGAVGPGGLREKDIALKVVLRTKAKLVAKGFNVTTTRDGDYAPGHYEGRLVDELNERVRISEQFMGSNGLLVSIHLNSYYDTTVDGTETLIYGFGGQAEKAAKLIQAELVTVAGVNDRGLKAQGVLVLRKTSCPAVLTESVFVSCSNEDARLRLDGFIENLANAHVAGICKYFGVAV